MTLLEVEDLHVAYGASEVLHGASVAVPEGRVVALLGRNGMGKTTLVHTVMGVVEHRAGHLRLGGRALDGMAPEQRNRAGLTLVPQGHRMFPSLSVAEHLSVAHLKRGDNWTPDDVVEVFPRLKERWTTSGSQLSGGEQQMLAVGRAMVGNGQVMLMDEPTEGVDRFTTQRIAEAIDEIRRRGTSVLLVEQKVDVALRAADEVYVMRRGQITLHEPDAARLRADRARLDNELSVGIDSTVGH